MKHIFNEEDVRVLTFTRNKLITSHQIIYQVILDGSRSIPSLASGYCIYIYFRTVI